MDFCDSSLGCEWLGGLGSALPALEVLRAHRLEFQGFKAVGGAAWAPLPFLREIALEGTCTFGHDHLMSSAELGALLGRVFDAAPGLQSFRLDAGSQCVTGRDRKEGVRPPPPVALAGALQLHPPPQSLRALTLCKITVAASDLDLDLPDLRALALRGCGPQAQRAATALAAKYKPGALKVEVNAVSTNCFGEC